MWMSAVWVGPGIVGTTLLVPPIAPIILANSSVLITSFDKERSLDLMSAALHVYTLTVTVTLSSLAGASVVPLI